MKKIVTLLSLILLSFGCFAQLNYNAKAVIFRNADSTTVRSLATQCGNCGVLYYNSQVDSGKFRVYQDSTWYDLVGGGGGDISGTLTAPFIPVASATHTLINSPYFFSNTTRLTATPDGLVSPFNLGASVAGAPSNTTNADLWYDNSAGVIGMRAGGTNLNVLGGNLTSGRVPYSNGVGSLTDNANFRFTSGGGTQTLTVDGTAANVTLNGTSSTLTVADASNSTTIQSAGLTANHQYSITTGNGAYNLALTAQGSGNINLTSGATGTIQSLSRHTFTPTATLPGLNIGSYAGDPSTKANGDMWYNSTANLYRSYIGGSMTNFIMGGVATNQITYGSGSPISVGITSEAAFTYNASTDLLTVPNATVSTTFKSPNVTQAGTILLNNTSASRTVSLTTNGAVYGADYSASYNNRSLVDKEYVATVLGSLKVKIVNIGDWDMDGTANVGVAHGLADFKQIRAVQVTIRDDADAVYSNAEYYNTVTLQPNGGVTNWTTTNVYIYRLAAGAFDNTSYDATSFNRGFITIWYVDSF